MTITTGMSDGYPYQSAAQPANQLVLAGMNGIKCMKILAPINEGYPYCVGESRQLYFGTGLLQGMAIGATPVMRAYNKNRAVFLSRHG